MAVQYIKRFRMMYDFATATLPAVKLPPGYYFEPWDDVLLELHAQVKYDSFHDEMDSLVFPCLGEYDGCLHLMEEISLQPGFLPSATWLLMYHDVNKPADEATLHTPHAEPCGTIQGLCAQRMTPNFNVRFPSDTQAAPTFNPRNTGSIQNVGITAEHRQQGLGRALVVQCLQGFQQAGVQQVYLEVTAANHHAVQLYQHIGFRLIRTMYRTLVLEEPAVSV